MSEKINKYSEKPKGKETRDEKQLSSLINDAKRIYEQWKNVDKTYNKNKIENKLLREKYLYFKHKWEEIKKQYENIKNSSLEQKTKLIKEIQELKNKNTEYESISTIANIYHLLKQENKNNILDKTLQKLNIAQNIKEITQDPKKIIQLLKILEQKTGTIPQGKVKYNYIISKENKKLTKQEKILYQFLNPIKNFYNYAKERGVKIDLKKNNKIFNKEVNNFARLEKIYNNNTKNRNKKQNENEKSYTTQTKNTELNNNYIKLKNGTYNKKSGIIVLNIPEKGLKTIKVPEEDRKILNPKNIENYIKLNETLEELGIPNIKKFISTISNTLGTIGKNIKYNDDFLNETELKKVLNAILLSTGYSSINEEKKWEEFKNIFKIKNKQQINGGYKNKSFSIGNSPIEESFIKIFAKNNNFEINKFKKAIIKNPT